MADKVHVRVEGDDYWIEGGHFADMLEAVKQIPGRQYDSREKTWNLSGTAKQVARALHPYHLMWIDDDPLGDSTPTRILP